MFKFKSENLLISIIIPVFNGEKFIFDALKTMDEQEYEDKEIIIVDDGSKDKTAEIIKSLNREITYVYQENKGPSAARNKGLEIAKGEFIVFLDIDDLWPKNKLKSQISVLLKHKNIDVSMGQVQILRLNEQKNKFEKQLDPGICFNIGSAVFRRSVFEKNGIFNETLRYGEDFDWWMRVREKNIPVKMFNEVSLFYRLHLTNMTNISDARDLNAVKVLKMSLDRRKQMNNGIANGLKDFCDLKELKI